MNTKTEEAYPRFTRMLRSVISRGTWTGYLMGMSIGVLLDQTDNMAKWAAVLFAIIMGVGACFIINAAVNTFSRQMLEAVERAQRN